MIECSGLWHFEARYVILLNIAKNKSTSLRERSCIYVPDEKMRVELTVKDNSNKKKEKSTMHFISLYYLYILLEYVFYTYTRKHTNMHKHTYPDR